MTQLPEPTGAFHELTIRYPQSGIDDGVLHALIRACEEAGYSVEFERGVSTNQYENPSLPLTTHRTSLCLFPLPVAPAASAN